MRKFLAFLALVFALVALLPTIGSTPGGKELLLGGLNRMIPGEVRVETIALSWTGVSRLEKLELLDAKGAKLATIEEFRLLNGLWRLLTARYPNPSFTLKGVEARVVADESGLTDIERAISSEAAQKPVGKLFEPIVLEKVEVAAELLAKSKRFKIVASGTTRQGALLGSFAVDGDLGKEPRLKLEATQFPTILLDQLVQLRAPDAAGLLTQFLGEAMDVQISIENSRFEHQVSTPSFKSHATAKLEEGVLTLLKPMTVDLQLPTLRVEASLELDSQVRLIVAAKGEQFSAHVDWQVENRPYSPTLLALMESPSHFTVALKDAKGAFNGSGSLDHKGVVIVGDLQGSQWGVEGLTFTSLGIPWEDLSRDFRSAKLQGTFAAEKLTLGSQHAKIVSAPWSYDGRGDLFETHVVARDYSDRMTALFGPELKGKLAAQMNGPVSLTLSGDRCALSLDGKVSRGILTLNTPLTLDVTVSKEVSDHFLDDLVPLLNSATHADAPLRLAISDKGFALPLRDFDQVAIPSASLTLGKVYFTKEGKLAQVLSLLKIKPEETFSVWFTPLYFSLLEGKLTLYRLDMLVADQVPLATWGWLDFPTDAVHLDVGLTGKAVVRAFGALPLPKNYMLAIPLRGPTANPRLDTTQVAAKLASLAAQSTGPQGALVGALINLASGSYKEQIPAPTTKPLPWDTDPEPGEISENELNPVNELKRGAEKLLNSLFR